jgi:hypothetical protein
VFVQFVHSVDAMSRTLSTSVLPLLPMIFDFDEHTDLLRWSNSKLTKLDAFMQTTFFRSAASSNTLPTCASAASSPLLVAPKH